jgi:hypothetical protein
MSSHHSFHIPVMGLAYTIDTPIKVARYGINSVISIVQDSLIEKMRSHYYAAYGETYHPITIHETDYRAKRITDYLNLVNRIVADQLAVMQQSAFVPGSDITKYFEMLSDDHQLKEIYNQMLALDDPDDKAQLENWLRKCLVPGSIDVNIMTKLDRNTTDKQGNLIEDGSDALTALRGYTNSTLTNSSVILSAGMNPRLFNYIAKLEAFQPNAVGVFQKKIVVKVSDYRSALVQGKMLAKKGVWVSEFRIESGLNCGGHAFATDGYLLGPILEEFKARKQELIDSLFLMYNEALASKGIEQFSKPLKIKITVQGGIGTAHEHNVLLNYYGVDGTGWGTPFLLVPEATTVDDTTLSLLSKAQEPDVILSKNSPLGVRFHYLKGTSAENEKLARIKKGNPGSPCSEKYLVSNTEFSSTPICTASRTYQHKKIAQLKSLALPEPEYQKQAGEVLSKECLCVGLSNSAVQAHRLTPFKGIKGINICPGPNIAYFNEIVSLKRMTDHIYGRTNIISRSDRPHMFIKELMLYTDYWTEFLNETKEVIDAKRVAYIEGFQKNLLTGIEYYRSISAEVLHEVGMINEKIDETLTKIEKQLDDSLKQFLQGILANA